MSEKNCLICNKELKSKDKFLCYSCYKETNELLDEDDYEYLSNVTDHYFNQKRAIYRVKTQDYRDKGISILCALTLISKSKFNSNKLFERIEEDVKTIYEKIYNNGEIVSNEETDNKTKDITYEQIMTDDADYRKIYPANIRCKDGHYVRSKSEKIIDDFLYDNNILHAYEKQLFIEEAYEVQYIPDFYLKHEDTYIEFWGMDEENYLKKKEEKLKFYNTYGVKVINLEEKDIEHLEDILPKRIAKIKNNKEQK